MVTRFIVATIILGILLNRRILKTTRRTINGSIADILFLDYTQTVGQTGTNISNVAFLTATNVIMIPFISWVISKNKPNYKLYFLPLALLCKYSKFQKWRVFLN